jgi:hypothetical protein
MEYIFLIIAILLFGLFGFCLYIKLLIPSFFSFVIGLLYLQVYINLINKTIEIKSTEKLQLIETVTTPTDTTYKYKIKNK